MNKKLWDSNTKKKIDIHFIAESSQGSSGVFQWFLLKTQCDQKYGEASTATMTGWRSLFALQRPSKDCHTQDCAQLQPLPGWYREETQ
jgi:hypothetical protein